MNGHEQGTEAGAFPKPVTLAIIGAGKRGEAYADYALKHPGLAKVVAVAEPRRI